MKPTVIESGQNSNEVNHNLVTTEKNTSQFVTCNQVNKDSGESQAESAKPDSRKAGQVKQMEIKEEPKMIVLNLEDTLKLIEEMHRKAEQRTKLQDTIKNLDDFEVELREEADTNDTNYYNGCVLTIEYDNRRKFETNTPRSFEQLRNW